MRVVSQDGTMDFPYDKSVIWHAGCFARVIVNNKEFTLAKYSSAEKMNKAMEMLREEYQKYYSNSGGGMMATENFYVQPFAFNHPKVFQFPQDEEIEV